MRPMSVRSRRALALGAFVAFIILVPLVVSYVNGYRLTFTDTKGQTSVTSTGAIVLDTLVPGSSVYIDGVYSTETPNFFSETLFIDGMSPGLHAVDISATGTTPWHKDVTVLPRYVALASALILPDPIPVRKVLPELEATSSVSTLSTSTEALIARVPMDQYEHIHALFNPASTTPVATSTSTARINSSVALWTERNHIVVFEWQGSMSRIPRFFCSVIEQENVCVTQVHVPVATTVLSVDFFPGRKDVAIILTHKGLFALETDAGPRKPAVPIFLGPKIEYRIWAGALYVKEGKDVFYVRL